MKYITIFFDAVLMAIITPFVVIIAGAFQTYDEWKEAIEGWKQDLKKD